MAAATGALGGIRRRGGWLIVWIAYMLAFFLALAASMTETSIQEARARIERTTAAATSMNFGVYANAAHLFSVANPGFTGVIPVASLKLPAWYEPRPALAAYMDGSRVLVFEPQASGTAAAGTLRMIAVDGVKTGVVMGGQVVSPTNAVIYAAPGAVPENAVVRIVR